MVFVMISTDELKLICQTKIDNEKSLTGKKLFVLSKTKLNIRKVKKKKHPKLMKCKQNRFVKYHHLYILLGNVRQLIRPRFILVIDTSKYQPILNFIIFCACRVSFSPFISVRAFAFLYLSTLAVAYHLSCLNNMHVCT